MGFQLLVDIQKIKETPATSMGGLSRKKGHVMRFLSGWELPQHIKGMPVYLRGIMSDRKWP